MPIFTAHIGTSADVFPHIVALYVPEGSVIADVTYGRGVFWRHVDVGEYDLRATVSNRPSAGFTHPMSNPPHAPTSAQEFAERLKAQYLETSHKSLASPKAKL